MQKLVKEKSTNKYIEVSDIELSNNPSLYIDRSYNPVYWLKFYEDAGFTYFRARYLVKELFLSKVNGLDDFRSEEKDALIDFGLGNQEKAIIHIMTTLGLDQVSASGYYAQKMANHIAKLSPDASEIIISPKILLIGVKYLTQKDPVTGILDTTQADNFILAIRGFLTDYERYNLIGTTHGDSRDGIADYYGSTGNYTSGGLKNYVFNTDMVALYGTSDLARLEMIKELDEVFVKGNI